MFHCGVKDHLGSPIPLARKVHQVIINITRIIIHNNFLQNHMKKKGTKNVSLGCNDNRR